MEQICAVSEDAIVSKAMLWHLRLGHLNVVQLRIVLNKFGIKCLQKLDCITCIKGKLSAKPPSSDDRLEPSTAPLDLIHSDICGSFRVESN